MINYKLIKIRFSFTFVRQVFVLQLEGTKQWKLYKPMVELSRDYTQDLPQDSIGEPIMEQILEVIKILFKTHKKEETCTK